MSDNDAAPAGGDGEPSVVLTPAADARPASTTQGIAALLKEAREKAIQPDTPAKEPVEPTPPETKLADEASNGDPAEVPAEVATEEPEPDDSPPIERPRSWTKDTDETWQALPRNLQEKVAEREQARERELRRSQNEAADKLKGLTAKEQALEQARQQYETRLPALLQTLQSEQAGAFSDIKTVEDVTKLAVDDPFRFNQFQAHQMKLAAVQNEVEAIKHREASEKNTRWAEFAQKQDALLVDSVPEMADKKKAEQLSNSALETLRDNGFTDSELGDLWSGKCDISLRDHRVQKIIIDAVKFRDGKATAAAKVVKVVPKVQRPGVSAPNNSAAQRAQELRKQIANTRGMAQDRLIAQLMRVQREAAS